MGSTFSFWSRLAAILALGLAGCSDVSDTRGLEEIEPGSLSDYAEHAGLEVGAAIDWNLSDERKVLVAREFTSVTVENSLKWQSLSPTPVTYDFSMADEAVAIAETAGLRIRGHTLFWHRLNGLPQWLDSELESAQDPAARLEELMENHAAMVVGRYAGRLTHWDVVNEPLALVGGDFDPDNIFFQTLGETYLDIAFHSAYAADPGAILFLNETFTEFQPAKFDALLQLAEGMLTRGVPIHGVGLQAHFFFQPPDPVMLQEQLQRIVDLGLLAELTELDIPLPLFEDEADPLAAQGRAYVDVFNACLAVPGCSGITQWGVDDADTWLDSFVLTAGNAPNRPLLFDESGEPKPAYYSVIEALKKSE